MSHGTDGKRCWCVYCAGGYGVDPYGFPYDPKDPHLVEVARDVKQPYPGTEEYKDWERQRNARDINKL